MKRTNTAVWMEKHQRWQIKVQKDGERKTFYSSTKGRTGQREANAKADQWLEGDIVSQTIKVKDAYKMFLETIPSAEDKKAANLYGDNYIIPSIGNKKVANLSDDDFQTIIEKASKKGKSGKPLAKRTLMSMASIMKRFAKYCRRKKLSTLTLEFLEVPSNAPTSQKSILQPSDLRKLFECDQTKMHDSMVFDDYIHAYRFQVLTGLRPSELLGLRWNDIDGKKVSIHRGINKYSEITEGKNKNARRYFYLTDTALEEINAQREISASESVFEIQSQSTYRHRWKRFCEANDITYIPPYDMRHTFVSMCRDLTDGQLKAIVGHSKNMDTWGVYGHDINEEKVKIADKIQTIITELLTAENKKEPLQ